MGLLFWTFPRESLCVLRAIPLTWKSCCKALHHQRSFFRKLPKKIAAEIIKNEYITFYCEDWVFQYDFTYEKLKSHFGTANLKGFGIEELEFGIVAAGGILYYLEETEHREVQHISSISRIAEEKYVWLDKFTIRNLELVFPQHDGGVPLIQILDQTVTPMGSRMMKKWMVLPLKEKEPIEERLNVVDFFSTKILP